MKKNDINSRVREKINREHYLDENGNPVKYSRIKIGYDVTCLTITALMTCIILGHLDGLGIGTILAAFTMGKVIGMIGDKMDQHVRFESFMTKRV